MPPTLGEQKKKKNLVEKKEGKVSMVAFILGEIVEYFKGLQQFALRGYQANTTWVWISKVALITSHWAAVRLWLWAARANLLPWKASLYTPDLFLGKGLS